MRNLGRYDIYSNSFRSTRERRGFKMSINKVNDKDILLIGVCALLVVISLVISCWFFYRYYEKKTYDRDMTEYYRSETNLQENIK